MSGTSGRETRLSVVIVTWNSAAVIGGCLRSLRAATQGRPTEVIVVDNGSSDGTPAVARQADPSAVVVENGANRGLPAANNQGLRRASADYVLICNPDVVFTDQAVDALVDTMGRHPTAGWVIPRLLYEDGTVQTSAGDLPTLSEALLGRQVRRSHGDGSTQGFWWDGWAHDAEQAIGRGHEAAYLVRAEALRSVGVQDERYRLDWEGFDWTDRFRRAGWEIWLSPGAEVVHLGGTSIRQVPVRWVVSHHRGMYLYFSERKPRWWRPALAAAFTARALLKLGAVAVGLPMYQLAHRGHPPSHGSGSGLSAEPVPSGE